VEENYGIQVSKIMMQADHLFMPAAVEVSCSLLIKKHKKTSTGVT
jgi:hypothetical protein